MKKLSLLLWVLCMSMLVACSSSDSDEEITTEEGLKKALVGEWYRSEDNLITSWNFTRDGNGNLTVYQYLQKQWNTYSTPLQYTVSGNTLTFQSEQTTTPIGTISITGNSLSVSNGEEVVVMTKYNGGESKTNELKKEIENKWTELEPGGSGETPLYASKEGLLNAINGIYNSFQDYEYKQLNLEQIRISGNNLIGYSSTITARSSEVYAAWEAAYLIIASANNIISTLESPAIQLIGITGTERLSYKNEALALRSLVYYNIAQLWGSVPYIVKSGTQNPPVYSQSEIYNELRNTLSHIVTLPQEKGHISLQTIKAIQSEIALSQGKPTEAANLLINCTADFSILINAEEKPSLYKLFGTHIPNYTADKVTLLLKEANSTLTTLVADWQESTIKWGYWAMLKRTGKAETVTNCKKHELLMPYPQRELDMNPSLTQHPGYE